MALLTPASLRAVLALLFFLPSAAGAAEATFAMDSPAATVATLQQGLVAVAQRGAKSSVEARYQALAPLIAATHNLPYIGEFALRRQWSGLAAGERQQFLAAFERLSVMTYAARFANVGAQTFRPITVAAAPDAAGRVQVTTAVARAGQSDVKLEYLLQQDERGWRIVNIVADGVSDLALKRAEYQRLFAAGSLAGLLAEINAQTERLRSN